MALRTKSKYVPTSKPAPHSGPVLFCRAASAESHWLRLIIAEKGIDGARVLIVDPRKPPEDLLVLAPNSRLPTLGDRDTVIQSAGIIAEYLDERYPHPPMMPTEPALRAGLRMALRRLEGELLPLLDASDGAGAGCELLLQHLCDMTRLFPSRGWFLGLDYSIVDSAWTALLWKLGQQRSQLPGRLQPIWEYAQRNFARPAFRSTLA